MPVSLESQIVAVELRRMSLEDLASRKPKYWQQHDYDRAAMLIEHLAAAVKTLRWLQKHEATIRARTGEQT